MSKWIVESDRYQQCNMFPAILGSTRLINNKIHLWNLKLNVSMTPMRLCNKMRNFYPENTLRSMEMSINTVDWKIYDRERCSLLWVRLPLRARCTTSCDTVCQWLVTDRWFSPGTPVSSTNKTDRHDITEILFKVALNTRKQPKKHTLYNQSQAINLYLNEVQVLGQKYLGLEFLPYPNQTFWRSVDCFWE